MEIGKRVDSSHHRLVSTEKGGKSRLVTTVAPENFSYFAILRRISIVSLFICCAFPLPPRQVFFGTRDERAEERAVGNFQTVVARLAGLQFETN